MDTPKLLFITGMHRSYTSLVAHAFLRAGMHLGDDLIGAAPSNPHGHFECASVVNFHTNTIFKYGLASWWSKVHQEKALKVARSRDFISEVSKAWQPNESIGLQGWKDPRAMFFLDGWAKAYPSARFIIVLRHPEAVVSSLNKRVRASSRGWQPWMTKRHQLHWKAANQAALEWLSSNDEKAVVITTPESLMDHKKLGHLHDQLSAWDIDIKVDFDQVIDTTLLQQNQHRLFRNQSLKHVYDELSHLAL